MDKAREITLKSTIASIAWILTLFFIHINSPYIEVLGYNYIKFIFLFITSLLLIRIILVYFEDKRLGSTIVVIIGIIVGIFIITYGVFQVSTGIYIIDNLETEESCISHLTTIESAYSRAEKIICHAQCPCKAYNNYINILDNMNKSESLNYKVFSNRHIGASSVSDCDPCYEIRLYNESSSSPSSALTSTEYYGLVNWIQDNLNQTVSSKDCNIEPDFFKNTYFSSDEIEYFSILNKIEKKYGCSGFCSEKYFFMFSDVNEGEPKKSCRSYIFNEVKQSFMFLGVLNTVLGFCTFITTYISVKMQKKSLQLFR